MHDQLKSSNICFRLCKLFLCCAAIWWPQIDLFVLACSGTVINLMAIVDIYMSAFGCRLVALVIRSFVWSLHCVSSSKMIDSTKLCTIEGLCKLPSLVSYYTLLYYTILYYAMLYYSILFSTILHSIILYYAILYYTILYYTLLYNTPSYSAMQHDVLLNECSVVIEPHICRYSKVQHTALQRCIVQRCVVWYCVAL